MKRRFLLTLNCFLLASLVLASCSGAPALPSLTNLIAPTATLSGSQTPKPTSVARQQAFPPALIETDPPQNAVIGHFSPITFYFNQAMNKPSVESALGGVPAGTFTWNDEATLVFTPRQPYQSDTDLKITLANSIRSATGFGMPEAVEISYSVSDYLHTTNILPKANTTDVNVQSAIVASFDQPIVALGADSASLPPAFTLVPPATGQGEWINTSTYIFYPEPALAGGTEYAVSLDGNLKSVTGVGFAQIEGNAWKFVTAAPKVVSVSPSETELLPLDPQIKLTFNQPMETKSVEENFVFSGTEGAVTGKFTWNEDATELTFKPAALLARNVGHILNLGAGAKSLGGMTLGTSYGAVLRTYDNFVVTSSKTEFNMTTFTFSAPLAKAEYEDLVTVTPAVDDLQVILAEDDLGLTLYGSFTPDTDYAIELSGEIKDRWGQPLGEPYPLEMRTPPLPPSITPKVYVSAVTLVRPDEPVLFANIVNVQNADITVAPLSLPDFFSLQNSYENQQAYVPENAVTISQSFDSTSGQPQEAGLSLTQENGQLLTGLYYVRPTSPQIQEQSKMVYFVASSQVNLTFKLGATEAFVWAVDLPSQRPVANAPIVIYDQAGVPLASGATDSDGIWQAEGIGEHEPYSQVYAVLGAPGEENFALATNNWNLGISPYDFGYGQNVEKPHTEIYMYTDRPIYRPGQTVYFRGVVREAFNGRYQLPTVNTIPITLSDANGTKLSDLNLQLSPYGTFNGQFEIPAEAVPGNYSFQNLVLNFYFYFQVAEYRKPEIDLSVDFAKDEIKLGETTTANVNARYFFDAPASNVKVTWTLFTEPDYFTLPNFQTGLLDDSWLDTFRRSNALRSGLFGMQIGEGTGHTSPKGTLSIELPAIPESQSGQVAILEVTAEDESGLPVSARTQLRVHPADFYIGLRPDQWFGTAKSAIGFDVYTVDWAGNSSGDKTLVAEFKQVRWEKETNANGFPTYTPVYTPVSSSNLATGPDGRARLSFVPPTTGTFMLDVSGDPSTPPSGAGQAARTQILIWVGGAGSAAWPDLPNQRMELKADKESYKAGETANVFIPNPFATNSLALVTVERGLISKAQVITLSGSGQEYALPLTADDAPNVYLSVIALGQGNDFRRGLVNIPVAPEAHQLNVQVAANPPEAGPRESVTFDVVVTDNQGQPVEGEFSFAMVDKAVLALSEPNAEDIFPAFYKNQLLGIETGLSLVVYGGRDVTAPGGMGGGGAEDLFFLREDFPDTAYWNPSLVTNSEGRAQVTMTLPDSLTTWNIDVRGLTSDTRVGQAKAELVSTKPLLIRPVTPRFLVSGDHVLMAAIVNNNTPDSVQVAVNLQSDGFVLDDPGQATYNVQIPPNERHRLEWWGTVQLEPDQAEFADLVFSATTSGTPSLQDSARPVWGKLPILHYTSPQAFVTGGILKGAASQQEVISLPRTFAPTSGGLEVEFNASLAGSLLSALEAMRPPEGTQSAEELVSYLLPNIEVYRALNGAGLNDEALSERVTSDLNASISRLMSLQNEDGGWSWWKASFLSGGTAGEPSDPYISAYVLFGLQRAHLIGGTVREDVLTRAAIYLQQAQPAVDENTKGEALDEVAFIQFTLSQLGAADVNITGRLFDERNRLSPVGQAWLALTLHKLNPADTRVRDLISNLQSSALQTASSAHWETPRENIFTRGSTIYTTSVVLYALAQLDPTSQVLANAVRYLAAHRDASGLWNLGHDNAWAIAALNEAMIGIGDMRADFSFNATLNGDPLARGDIAGIQIEPLTANAPLEFLSSNTANLLTINREDGLGRLYYNAVLNVNRPVQDVKPLDNGMRIDRVYCTSALSGATAQSTLAPGASAGERDCSPRSSIQLSSNQPVTAQLTLVLPHDSYYVKVEDFIPAGMEILNRNLQTSQQGVDETGAQIQFDDKDPFAEGWGWWLFNEPQIRDDSILFSANFLPAGTYVLTYTLIPLQAGEYQVLPAHAWQAFFPEVQGTSAGAVFEIKP